MSDPKLILARDNIKTLLDGLDIAGHIVLHNKPGKFEVLTKLDPSYSRLAGVPPLVRIRSKLVDYAGDIEAQRRDIEATASMVRGIAEALCINGLSLMELADTLDAALGAEYTPIHPDTEH